MTARVLRKKSLLYIIMSAFFLALLLIFRSFAQPNVPVVTKLWKFQSIDTMKYSRDIAREKLFDKKFDAVIEKQVSDIAKVGATHVVIATPYDNEFTLYLGRWVAAARKNKLKVWFRGNWAGWEGWFSYPKIDRKTHIENTRNFILNNESLFEDGDVFSGCPECENGGPGDPRITGDVVGYRKFLIDEHKAAKGAFEEIGLDVDTSFNSMNGDVARLIMDKPTTSALGGTIVIDHYVKNPEQLLSDIKFFAEYSGGRVVLGEIGVPIPDIHGSLSESEQEVWLEEVMKGLIGMPEVYGLNYWTSVGGSTELWRSDGYEKGTAKVLAKYYKPERIDGAVIDELGDPVADASVSYGSFKAITLGNGYFSIPNINSDNPLFVGAFGYKSLEVNISGKKNLTVVLRKENENFLFKLKKFVRMLFPKNYR